MRQSAGELIEGIQRETLEGAQAFLEAGLAEGRNPTTLARDLVGKLDRQGVRKGGILGLNSVQTDALIRARSELLSGDPGQMRNYLRRKRRDRRFDTLVKRAIRDGKKLASADVQRLSDRYKARLLKLRADTIARTETITAMRAGRYEGYKQLVDSGQVADSDIKRTWDSTGDARTRLDHLTMEGQELIGMDSAYTAPDGSRMLYPGDTSLGASADQTIMCRCTERIRIRRRSDG